MFHAMVRFTLILLCSCGCLQQRLIITGMPVQVRTAPKHWSTQISNYQSSERKSNEHDESDQMKFLCVLKNALLIIRDHSCPFFTIKRIGLPCCTFVTVIVTCSLQIILLSNYSLLTISALADNTLPETTCHFLLLLVGFDTLTYRKELQLIPYTCGSSRLFCGAIAGE